MKRKIPDKKLLGLYARIRPVTLCEDGSFREIIGYKYEHGGRNLFKTPYTLRARSFTWDPLLGETIGDLIKVCDIETKHYFNVPNFFYPSIEEVLAEIPKKYLALVRAFETARKDETGKDDFGEVRGAWYHLATTRLYR